jgi:DNA repair protein RAD5
VLHPSLVLSSLNRSEEPARETVADLDTLIQRFSEGDSSKGNQNVFAENVLLNLGEDDGLECPICFDVMQTPMILPDCLHQW